MSFIIGKMRHEGAGLCASAKQRIEQFMQRVKLFPSLGANFDMQPMTEASDMLSHLYSILTNGDRRREDFDVVKSLQSWLRYSGCEGWRFSFDTNVRKMNMVPVELREIVTNLLKNAFAAQVKAGTTEPLLHVALLGHSRDDEPPGMHTTVTVTDNGPGLPDDAFSAFVKGRLVRRGDGLPTNGYGLLICRELADDYDGSISYHRFGSETVFSVTLLDTCVETMEMAGYAMDYNANPKEWRKKT